MHEFDVIMVVVGLRVVKNRRFHPSDGPVSTLKRDPVRDVNLDVPSDRSLVFRLLASQKSVRDVF